MKPLPILMSLNAGFVDTAAFLAPQGLFTAHVTGNFVTFGAALVNGTSGAFAKLLALPVFCAVVLVTRIFSFLLPSLGLPILRTMLAIKTVFLALGAYSAIRFCRFGFDLSLDSKKSCIFKGHFLLPFESILVPLESIAHFSGSIGV
jgi:uncharacterized membrane protein YoaK (UPF0700 family)